jgi:ankyrin repeat protein
MSSNPLFDAANKGDLQTVKALIARQVNVNIPGDGEGRTALFVAARDGRLDIVKVYGPNS